jgi:hypothetical protein
VHSRIVYLISHLLNLDISYLSTAAHVGSEYHHLEPEFELASRILHPVSSSHWTKVQYTRSIGSVYFPASVPIAGETPANLGGRS